MRIFFLLIFFVPMFVFSQKQNKRSLSEFGIFGGGSYYLGDLNRGKQFEDTKPAFGAIYRYNKNPRLTYRATVTYGNVQGDDQDSKVEVLRNRNLDFKSSIYEVAAGVELHYFPFFKGHDRYKATGYILAELALFRMNPTTSVDGNDRELRSIGTEGQGTSLSKKGKYSRTQLAIPIGLGAKFCIGKRMSFNVEFGIRKTFTDYLDDVRNNNYVDPALLSSASGPLAVQLSNRSLNGDRFGYRGNQKTKDWYVMFGAMLTWRLGSPNKCAMPQ